MTDIRDASGLGFPGSELTRLKDQSWIPEPDPTELEVGELAEADTAVNLGFG